MVEQPLLRPTGPHERRDRSRLPSGICAFILLCSATIQVLGQDHRTHDYSARLIRSEGVNPFKPMLADLQVWLPEAEITLEREEDVLHITLSGDLSPEELSTRLERFAIHLASFRKDGALVDRAGKEDRLPWLIGPERTLELTPEQLSALKEAWVRDHPQEYQRLIQAQGDITDRK